MGTARWLPLRENCNSRCAIAYWLLTPKLSVVIPCYNSAAELKECLRALERAGMQDAECIVVDDGSTDGTREVVLEARFPQLLLMGQRRGSAAARNAGARAATGDVLVFLDADTTVHKDTLSKIAAAFVDDAGLGAVIGRYDDAPSAGGFYSQYRNLLHSHVHATSPRQGCTFWTGCGAIRREIFIAQGGFEESPHHIDDVEFGAKAARAGVRIELRPDIQVKHLKQWTFVSTLRTDLFLRGIPWTVLILQDGRMPDVLNVSYPNRFSVALTWLAAVLLATGMLAPVWVLAALACIATTLCVNRKFYRFLRHAGGTAFAVRGAAAHLLHFLVCGAAFVAGVLWFAARSSERSTAVPAALANESGD